MEPSVLDPIDDALQDSRKWRVEVNGAIVADVRLVQIIAPEFGVLTYGMSPDGYDSWSFREAGGGGVVVVPYVIAEEDLYVCVLSEYRYNVGANVIALPRGFVDQGETSHTAALRELAEEIGYRPTPSEMIALGHPANPNNAFFETKGRTRGVTFFAVQVPESRVSRIASELRLIPTGEMSPMGIETSAGLPGNNRFIHWTKAALEGDMFTNAGVARLLAHLVQSRRLTQSLADSGAS